MVMEGISLELKASDLKQLVTLAAEMAYEKLLASKPISLPRIGEEWVGQGGFFGGIMSAADGRNYALIVAAPQHEFKSCFSPQNVWMRNSQADGFANTLEMISSKLDFPAAEYAALMVIDGHDDFYVPSVNEMQILQINAPQLLGQHYYLTSTEYSDESVFIAEMSGGLISSTGKDQQRLVRPVRRIFI